MTKNTEQLFQERVDELLVLEQRVERRAEKFIELTTAYQERSQGTLDDLLGKVGGIDESLAKINAASDSVNAYVTLSATHALRTATLFLGTVVATVLIVAGTLWWSHYITRDLAAARAELTSLNVRLKHKPVILHFHGKAFVRVVPKTETSFTRNNDSDVPGYGTCVKLMFKYNKGGNGVALENLACGIVKG